jgi:CBS domain containing-hemolysin-like protein
MLDTLGHLPRPGERITTNEFSLTVEAVRENRIDLVRISRNAAPPDAGQSPASNHVVSRRGFQ